MPSVSGSLPLPFRRKDRLHSVPDLPMDNLKGLSTQELVERCRNLKNEAAWTELVNRVTPTIRGVIYRVTHARDPGLIVDLTQDTFVKLLQAFPKFEWKSERQFFGWVSRIAVNVVMDWIRVLNRRKGKEVPLENPDEMPDKSSAEDQILHTVICKKVEDCLRKAKAMEREIDILFLHYVQGFSAREISEMPGINLSEDRVETLLARLKRLLTRNFS